MCFAPQRRALFRDLNFQKWSEPLVFLTFWLPNVLRATTACIFPHLNFQKSSDTEVFCTFWLRNVLRATTACTFSTSQLPKVVRTWCVLYILTWKCASCHNGVHFSTSQLPKVVRTWCVLYILTWKCASCHNGVHFFDISTSKSVPRMVCFVHFDFEMCFAPQRRALFQHLNFQKWSERGVFCTFWLGNVLRATKVCNFSSLIWPAGFSEPTFRPSGAPNHWKNTVFRDFPTFSRICIFFLLTLLSSNLSLLSASSLLCFSSVHIVGSLTSKLPWISSNRPCLFSDGKLLSKLRWYALLLVTCIFHHEKREFYQLNIGRVNHENDECLNVGSYPKHMNMFTSNPIMVSGIQLQLLFLKQLDSHHLSLDSWNLIKIFIKISGFR